MTALLILERDELARTVTILGSDRIGEATMGLAAGERLTVAQLLWGCSCPVATMRRWPWRARQRAALRRLSAK